MMVNNINKITKINNNKACVPLQNLKLKMRAYNYYNNKNRNFQNLLNNPNNPKIFYQCCSPQDWNKLIVAILISGKILETQNGIDNCFLMNN